MCQRSADDPLTWRFRHDMMLLVWALTQVRRRPGRQYSVALGFGEAWVTGEEIAHSPDVG